MLITTKEVAALLRVHPKHVYRLLKRGLPARRVGDEWRFDEAEVHALGAARARRRGRPRARRARSASRAATRRPRCSPATATWRSRRCSTSSPSAARPLLGLVQADHATGLELLRRGAVLLAGCHGDAAPADAGRGKLAFIHVADARARPRLPRGMRVRRASAIVGRRFAGRPPSAGIRRCLDEALRREGVDPEQAYARATLHRSHRDAVLAVVRGEAEIALASRAWAVRARPRLPPARVGGLRPGPPGADLGDARVVALCEAAQSAAYRRRLADGLGYDAGRAGEIRFGTGGGPRVARDRPRAVKPPG